MIIPPAIEVVNGTHIVPLYFPTQFTPSQLDRLGWTAIVTITWPNILGVIALIFGTRNWYRYSYTPLAIAWFLSVALVAAGIFTRYGVYDHFLHYLAIAHVQWEWFIITYLLGYPFAQGYINATIAGLICFVTDLGFPGIRFTFLVASVIGGWGDVFMPLLLWTGGQRILAIGGIGHFLNALVTYYGFVDYIPIGPYFALQLIFGGTFILATVVGIFALQKPAIRLEAGTEEGAEGAAIVDGKSDSFHTIIPPPDRETIKKLALIAAVVSLAASLPLNFAPKVPFY